MCGVIGFACERFDAANEKTLRAVVSESMARGLHAFGISFIINGVALRSKVWPHAMDAEMLPYWERFENKPLQFIAHCRYSTSELVDNQPIFDDRLALAHNGVISQDPPEQWKKMYPKYKCTTRNDSELLFRSRKRGHNPFIVWPDASIAAVELSIEQGLRFYRNGKRPLFYAQTDDTLVVFSTQDIGVRAGLTPIRTKAGALYRHKSFLVEIENYVSVEDLQC
jgi:asparagine synthetase B (glutamine-hydrolysing)